jgi:hypothetical protein
MLNILVLLLQSFLTQWRHIGWLAVTVHLDVGGGGGGAISCKPPHASFPGNEPPVPLHRWTPEEGWTWLRIACLFLSGTEHQSSSQFADWAVKFLLTHGGEREVFYLTLLSIYKIISRGIRWMKSEYVALAEWYWQVNTAELVEKPVPMSLSATNPTWTGAESNPALRGKGSEIWLSEWINVLCVCVKTKAQVLRAYYFLFISVYTYTRIV